LPLARQGLRTLALQKANEFLADFGAQIGSDCRIGARQQDPQLDGVGRGIGDLHCDEPAAGCVDCPTNSMALLRIRSMGAV